MNSIRTWPAAGLVLISLQAVAATPLPRVFFTPQERAEIVQRRSAVVRAAPGAAVPPPGAVVVTAAADTAAILVQTAPQVLRLEGLSIASSGATFAWIGGQRYANGARVAGHRLEISAQGVVMVDAGGRSHRVRVGEAINDPVRTAGAKP